MKQVAPAIACALLAGGAIYGLLAAVRPAGASLEDPWLEAWRRAGLHVQFRTTSNDPSRHLQWFRERERYARPEFSGTRLRSYLIQGFRAQVVELPSDGLPGIELEDWPEEGPLPGRVSDRDNHAWQEGRHLLILAERQRVALWTTALPKETRLKIEQAFRETAKRLP